MGLPRATTSPRTPATPPPTPPTTPFSDREASLATMALPQSQGLALATALDLATTSNGGLNSQLLSYLLTLGVIQESWSRSEPFAPCNLCTRRQEGARGGRGNPGGDSAEVRTILTPFPLIKSSDTCMHCILTSRFDTRPAPASPESQVLVRQEESPDTATNSETFLLLISCSYSFDPGICQL